MNDVRRRGKLRVYLGAAPGVGKTVAMLAEGVRALERGRDVVLAGFDARERPRTMDLAAKLLETAGASVPCGQVGFDLDETLRRRPQVALVDDLATPNDAGARNRTRWLDVEELLAAGIDVVSTLNIAEVESLSDVAAEILGVGPVGTVPDAFVRAAEQIELVDMTPEALRRRLAHGNVFLPERVDAALAHQFRLENLAALRQLTLLWLADRVEDSLARYREGGREPDWETKERVVVGMTGAPGSDAIIRRAARLAERGHGDLVGVHVRGDSKYVAAALVEHRKLLEEMGGTYREVANDDVAAALVAAARAEGATQLVVGDRRAPRIARRVGSSLVRQILSEADGGLDVHVVAAMADADAESRRLPELRRRRSHLSRRRQLTGLVVAAAGLPALTAALLPVRENLGFTSTTLCFLLAVVLSATIGGMWPAVIAALGGFGLLNWYFADPVRTFTIANNHDLLALISFLIVAGVVSVLVDLAARRATEARRARGEAEALAGMAGSLLREGDPLPELLRNIVALFGLTGASVLAEGSKRVVAVAGDAPPLHPDGASASFDLGPSTSLLVTGDDVASLDRSVVGAFADQVALALESRRLHAEAAASAALAQANELRSALLAAVSHDLRTPLAAIKASASSLLSDDVEFDRSDEQALLQTIDTEADRLNGLVGDLLDMSRIQTGALVVQTRPVSVDEVVSAALGGMAPDGPRLRLDIPETLPLVQVDPALLERALANIIANAAAWAPASSDIRVESASVGGRVDIRVVDRGPGIRPDDRERVFLPFQRLGDSPNGVGVGLGLALARGFVDAMGGSISIDDTPGGGTTMTISVPPAVEP